MLLVKVKKTIKGHNLISRKDRIVAGISGGADSLALLFVLNSLKKELNLHLHAAHLDHMLRKDSDKDARFVRTLAQKLHIPVTLGRVNVKELAKTGSLEEAARNARLGFLFKVAKDFKAKKIALGHNLDDQAETVLMRILRGSGLYGLCGILPNRQICGFRIIRPLIQVRRKEIETYLKRKKIKPRIDKSNLESVYFRNKIRNRLLPLLEKQYNRNIKELLSNMAECVGLDYDYLNLTAERAIRRKRRFNIERLKKMHRSMLRLLLRKQVALIKGDTRRFTLKHIKELEDLIFYRPANSIVDLPAGISVKKNKRRLVFVRRKKMQKDN